MSSLRTDCRRRMGKGSVLAAILALATALILPSTAWGASKVTDTYVPEPPLRLDADAEEEEPEEQGPFYGYMPVEYPTRSIHDANEGGYGPYGPNRAITIPAYYDARTTGAIMPIRDQNPFGTCWSFSAIAASESSLISHGLMTGPLDFSERQLAYFTYNPVNDPLGNLEGDSTSSSEGYLDQGGNERLAAYTLATWSGAVDETLAPYSEIASASDPYSLPLDASLSREHDAAHLVNMRQIPMNDREDVKLAIMEYGALDASVYYSDYYFNESTNSYFCADTTGTNHAVPIVGWDDNYPKENFAGETYVTPYGRYELPSSYRTLGIGSSVTITGSDEMANWLVFSPTEDGSYTFYSTGSSTDPYAILYRLGSNGLLEQVARNDDGPTGYDFSITASLSAGETYYLDCEDYRSSASYTVYVVPDSSGGGDDDVYGDTDLPSSSTQIFEDSPITVQTEEWLSFTPTEDGTYAFESSDADDDPKATLYAVSTVNGLLYELTTNDDGAGNLNFQVVYQLSAGRTYYLDCYSYGGGSTSYMVTVYRTSGGGSEDGDVYPPTSWIEIAADDSVSVSSGDWLRFTPTTGGTYTFSSTDCGDYDPVATLYEVSGTNGLLRLIDDNDDGGVGYNFSLTSRLDAGTTYFLYCGTYGGSSATYTVSVTLGQGGGGGTLEPPSSALPIAVGSPQTVSTGGTTTEWLRFTPSKDGSYRFSGSSTAGYDIVVYGVASNGLLGEIDDAYSQSSGSYNYSVNMRSSITYYLKCTVGSGQSFDVTAAYAGEAVTKGPSEDGAWLVRNSWGTWFGDEGYFWVSYEDTSMNGTASNPAVATIFECEPADNYDNIYQYDGTCNIAYTYVSSGGSVANIFEAKANDGGDELVQAVAFWLEDVNVNYSVQVYTGLTNDSNPTSGTAQLSSPVTGKTSYEGYYTVVLPQDVRVSAGEKFAVVVTVSHDNGDGVQFGFDESGSWGWASFTSSCLPGQSFARNSSSSSWNDTGSSSSSWFDYGNIRLKAFTSNSTSTGGIPISGATVTCSPSTFEYTGSAIRPTVTVILDGVTLRSGTDYTVAYQNNTNVGTATVTVTGRGEYSGTARGSFTITKARVTPPTAVTGLVYNGSSQTGVPSGTGYTLSGTTSATNAGSYSATARLADTANYMWSDGSTGTKTITWSIAQANISGATVSTIADQIYDGTAKRPSVTVRFNSMTLTQADYTLSYANNTNIGTATVTITGTGNFTGTKSVTFQIVEGTPGKTDISGAVFAMIPDQPYTGSPIRPSVTVRVGGTRLIAGVDYTIRYENNVEIGTADIIITGIGDYEGSASWFFNIVEPAPVNPFRDVTSSTGHYEDILWLASSGISAGWDMGGGIREFRPYNNVARADMAAFLCRLANGSDFEYEPTYSDVAYFSDVTWSTPHCREIWWLASQGISRGWTEGGRHYFRPYANVARCDMACFLMRMALGPDAEESYVPSYADLRYFSDVTSTTAHRNAVLWLAHEGISAGWTERDGSHTFRPYANVARADMAAFLHRMANKGLVPETM